MRKVAMLIAVEHYTDKRISQVKYAERDARELGTVLREHGFDAADQIILVDSSATKTSIESRVRKVIQGLSKDDVLYVFYAGHGFARNAKNFITCHDTNLDDLDNTSIPIEWLFTQFNQSMSQKIALFLDSCESGMLASANIRGIFTDMTEDELKEFFDKAEHRVCFAACKPGQLSYPSDALKHGIWTHHLIEALDGRAPIALAKGGLITSASLQNHLSAAVPHTLRNTFSGTHLQSPWTYGASSSEFLVGDVTGILAKRKASANPHATQLLRVRLLHERGLAVRALSGFKKHHRVPDRVTGATETFVSQISSGEIDSDLDKTVESLKAAFDFKRKDVTTRQSGGAGSIITPYFDYEITIALNPDDASEVIVRRQVLNIRDPDKVISDEFEEAFSGVFDTLELENGQNIDIDAVVDQIEAIDDERLTVRYDRTSNWCIIEIEGNDSTIEVHPDAFRIVQAHASSPKQLVESFFAAQKQLVDTFQLKQLPMALAPPPKGKPKK